MSLKSLGAVAQAQLNRVAEPERRKCEGATQLFSPRTGIFTQYWSHFGMPVEPVLRRNEHIFPSRQRLRRDRGSWKSDDRTGLELQPNQCRIE